MGDIMARILPAERIDLISERNLITARLYGIHNNTTATRIMSATKHMGAKSIHIPKNGRTGKKRSFAIIGFQSQNSCEKATTSHVEIFGCKTWWSTKDNTKDIRINTGTNNSPPNFQTYREYQNKAPELSWESEDSSSTYSEESSNSIHTRKGKKVVITPRASRSSLARHNSLDWVHMAGLLERIENRLNKLEEKETRITKSGLKAHNRS
jgi:hypothetical protein